MVILLSLAVLRVRSLRQRRADPDVADRLRVWRRSVVHLLLGLLLAWLLIALHLHGGTLRAGLEDFDLEIVLGILGTIVLVKSFLRKLPSFLS